MSKPKKYSRSAILKRITEMSNASEEKGVEAILQDAFMRISRLPKDDGALNSEEWDLILAGKKIAAVKAVRQRLLSMGCGLKEAKTIVDNAMEHRLAQPLPKPASMAAKSEKRPKGRRPKGKKSMRRQRAKKPTSGEKDR